MVNVTGLVQKLILQPNSFSERSGSKHGKPEISAGPFSNSGDKDTFETVTGPLRRV
ncbi:MAG TPA: hypothetical protein VGR76_09970 [Candidatus Angelobacter sp.]|jgi:hypothetical protein|nr:hypothetical protein [Candidatus Angelobacter sp.]